MGNLVDITPEGVMTVSEKTHPTDKPFRLSIELSDDITDKPFLELSAKSIWCRLDVDPHFYNTGFELLDLTLQDREIIDTYGFRDNLEEKSHPNAITWNIIKVAK
jgi:hypothetical protein